jgi:endoribonuclease LACTB2
LTSHDVVGTNTYIIGSQNPYVLLDTGEGLPQYIPVLESAFKNIAKPSNPTEPDVSDIVISHWHHDHLGGLPSVLSLLKRLWDERKSTSNISAPFKPPRLHKFPLAPTSPQVVGNISSILDSLSPDSYTPPSENSTHHLHDLSDSQILPTSDSDPKSSLQILHTPGHTSDSIAIYLPFDKAIYTADTILGQGTAVFEDLGIYMKSLQKILDFASQESESGQSRCTQLYPGHGPVVTEGPKLINSYIQHRLEREKQIIELLKMKPAAEELYWTTWTIVGQIYEKYPKNLWSAAAHGIELHLKKLTEEGKVKKVGGEGHDTTWEPNGELSNM